MKKLLTIRVLICILQLSLPGFAQPDTTTHESALILSQYIQRASVSGNEKEAGEYFASICKAKGLFVEILSDDQDRYNFTASLYPLTSGKPNILLLSHIDVVPAGDEADWTHGPFSGTIHNNEVWGRGAIDAKGLAIMQLMALLEFKKEAADFEYPYNVTLLAVSAEESDSKNGAEYVVENYFDQLNPIVVLGEGGAGVSNLLESNPDQKLFCVSTGEKQAIWLKLIIDLPTSGHGSVPPNEYANQVAVKALSKLLRKKQKIEINEANKPMFKSLGKLEKGIRGVALKNISFFKPLLTPVLRKVPEIRALVTNTYTVTNISNPTGSTNQIAQQTIVSLDCRLLPGTDKGKFIAEIKKSLRKQHLRVEIELETINARESTIKNLFYQNFKKSIEEVHQGSKVIPILFPAYTDNSFFRKRGVPVYGIVPVHLTSELMESVHNSNERLPIKSLLQGIDVYKSFLQKQLTPSSLASAF